ncbi:hypothetical protein OFY05_23455 (plasmid) [Pseudocitrobacter faecalis]|nr:hypothetical protein OFY05_23455 [Pseudocitrobacter faecalis]
MSFDWQKRPLRTGKMNTPDPEVESIRFLKYALVATAADNVVIGDLLFLFPGQL